MLHIATQPSYARRRQAPEPRGAAPRVARLSSDVEYGSSIIPSLIRCLLRPPPPRRTRVLELARYVLVLMSPS